MSEFAWQRGKEYQEIIYETLDGIAKITINRPRASQCVHATDCR